jgi:Protein of unknown function (DUF3175)
MAAAQHALGRSSSLRRRASSGGRKAAPKPTAANRRDARSKTRWSGEVTAHSDALDLQPGVFKRGNARSIARSLKRSAEQSRRRKASPFQSAMSMLNFYINRAGKGLPAAQRSRLQAAKSELRALYGRPQR